MATAVPRGGRLRLFIDVGTNGEIALGHEQRTVATARSVTPAQAASASSSMSPEHSSEPSPPVAGCRPAVAIARPVSTLQLTPTSPIASGDRLVVLTGVWSAGRATISGVPDSAGNVYTRVASSTASSVKR